MVEKTGRRGQLHLATAGERSWAGFLKKEISDDSVLDLPSFNCFEGGVGEKRIESLLGLDTRLSQVDRDFLLRFFEKLGLANVADLQDVGVLRPLPDYLCRELETYQQEQGCKAAKSGAMLATLGRLLKQLEQEAPSKGTGKGRKSPRYRIHLSDRSGPYGQPKGRGRSRSPRNGGRSSGGSRQRQLPQHQQRQQQEPALWMAARTGDTEKCQQLLAVRAEVDVRSKRWTPLMGAAELGHAGVVSLLLENKANVNAANKKGRSALSFAVCPSNDGGTRRESQIPVMEHLLSHGADVCMRDVRGRTVLQQAWLEGRAEVADSLRAAQKWQTP